MEENLNEVPQNEEVEQQVVGEVPENTPESVMEPKKKGKVLPIVIGVVVFVAIVLVAGFFYIRSQRTAVKYIDSRVKEVKESIEDNFSDNLINNIGTLDFLNEDIKSDGSIKISSSGNILGVLDSTELSYDMKMALDKDYLETKLGIKDKNTSISGTLYFNGEKIYLDSKDVYETPIVSNLGVNFFKEIKQEFSNSESEIAELQKYMDLDKLKSFSLKTVDFISEALKETVASTKQKGLNVEYTYVLNKESVNKALKSFKSSVKSDKSYKELIEELTGTELDFEDTEEIEFGDIITLRVEVGMFDNKLKDMTIIYNDQVILSKVKDDDYKLIYTPGSEDSYAILTIKDDEFGAKLYVEGQEIGSFYMISKKNDFSLKVDIKSYGMDGEIKIKNVTKNETEISLKANLAVATIKANATIKTNNKNKVTVEGSLDASLSELLLGSAESIKLDYKMNYEHGKDIVSIAKVENAKNVNDGIDISSNLQEKITNLGIYKLIESLIPTYGTPVENYDYTYDYDFDYDFSL